MRSVVVGAGFLGKAIARAAARSGHDVTLVSRSPFALPDGDGVTSVVGDVCDPGVLEPLVGPGAHVFHCSGTAVPSRVEGDPAGDLATSLPPLLAVLTAVRRHENTCITLLSSGGLVYGRPDRLPIDEDHPTRPVTAAGVNKLLAEQYVRLHAERRSTTTRVRILRCANAYGPEQPARRGQGIVAELLAAARDGTPVTIHGEGSAVRDYVHADDVGYAAVKLAEQDEARTLTVNVGSGSGTTVAALVDAVERIAQRAVERTTAAPRAIDVPAVVLDTRRLQSLVPSFEARAVEHGIAELWQALQDRAPVAPVGGR
jgi:UDP-glucose 4-epimerase